MVGKNSWSLLFLLLIVANAFGQSREELERKRSRIMREINLTQRLIEETSEQQQQNIGYLVILKRQIANKQALINNIGVEERLLTTSIEENTQIISSLENDLARLKEEYEQMLLFAFKNRTSNDYVSYIFAAESFNQAWKRLKFIQYYSEARRSQIELIKKTQSSLDGRVQQLKLEVKEKSALLDELRKQKAQIEEARRARNRLYSELKSKETEYKKKLRADKKAAKDLEKAIEDVIRSSIAAADAESEQLTGLFEDQQAKLSWPVDGIVSSTFGRHEHPTIKGVYINNRGIDIRTQRGKLAKSVFSGRIERVIFIPGAHWAVIIRHGDFYTVYKNLEEVAVGSGDLVTEGQEIGLIYHDKRTGVSELHFEIQKKFQKLNPSLWLQKK